MLRIRCAVPPVMRSPEANKPVLAPATRAARLLALSVPALLLGGAYLSQYGFGLYPCEMCMWQRWPHFAAIALAVLAFAAPPVRFWTAIAAGGILTSGLIGGYHAGVEYGWWEGITNCAFIGSKGAGESALDSIMNTPMIRCDEAQWHLFGISLAGYNFLFSTLSALGVFVLLARGRHQ